MKTWSVVMLMSGLATFGCGQGPGDTSGSTSPTAASTASAASPSASGRALLEELERDELEVSTRVIKSIADSGDAATKRAAGVILLRKLRAIESKAWLDRNRPRVIEANRISRLTPTDAQLEQQLDTYRTEEVVRLLTAMAPLGGDEVVAVLLDKAEDARGAVEVQRAAAEALRKHPPTDSALSERAGAAQKTLEARGSASASAGPGPALDAEEALRVADVTMGAPAVTGGAVANAPVISASMIGGFRGCYVRALQEDGSLMGTIHVTAELDATGAVTGTTSEVKGNVSKVLASCAAARVARGSFAKPEKLPSSVTIVAALSIKDGK